MKERSVLPALIEVLDGGWVFTILVAMVGVEDVRRGREIGESTREDYEPHLWTGPLLGRLARMKEGGDSQNLEAVPWGHMVREDRK
ncbi:hypothetical protein AAG906_020650 [Vitis piasezkii]